MMTFITSALLTSTQRFLSFNQGKNDISRLKTIFSNSFYIHLFLGLSTAIVLIVCGPIIFDGLVKIPENRIFAAKTIYYIMIVILVITFTGAPVQALLISHENIVFLSIIGVCNGLLKVGFSILLYYFGSDKLIWYGIFMCGISLFEVIAYSIYSKFNYEEFVILNFKHLNKKYLREIFSFAGWTIYSTGCIIGRLQGTAILLNRFFGTTVNAAFGIGYQVSGMLQFLSSSLMNAVNPQMMKAEGANKRQHVIRLAEISSKFSFLLMAMVAIPCLFEIDSLLKIWLKVVPERAILFCQMFLITSLVDQLTIGLGSLNQSIGKIGKYSLTIYSIKLLSLPMVLFILFMNINLNWILFCFVGFELIASLSRLPFLKRTAGISIIDFYNKVIKKEFIPVSILFLTCFLIVSYIKFPFRFVFTFLISSFIYITSIYFFGLCKDEKEIMIAIIRQAFIKKNQLT